MATKKWRCTVCNYIHVGDNPPEVCPECGVGPEFFELLPEEDKKSKEPVEINPDLTEAYQAPELAPEERKLIEPALFKISYGLFVVGSLKGDKINAQTCNTVFQVTNDPMRVALGINKRNLTSEYIWDSKVLSVNILGLEAHDMVKNFGYRSGRDADKFADIPFTRGKTGAPLIDCIATMECRIIPSKCVDLGTHHLFIADVVAGKLNEDLDPMTYAYFRKTK